MRNDLTAPAALLSLVISPVVLLLLLGGCSSGPAQPAAGTGQQSAVGAGADAAGRPAVSAEAGKLTCGDFTLARVDALGRTDLQPDGLKLELGGQDGSWLNIAGEELAASHSLYLHLEYDRLLAHPLKVELGNALAGQAMLLAITDEPGVVQLGIASIGEVPRLEGNIEIASVEFAPGAVAGFSAAALPPRTTSVAPKVGVKDLAFHEIGEQTLTWTFNGSGDYDQNGETTIGDITPVGLHFNGAFGGFNWHVARVADGDHNGEVNVGDITPIGVSFGSRTEFFEILVAGDESGPFGRSAEDPIPFDAGDRGSPGGPLEYQVRLQSPWPGSYYAVVASDGTEQAAVHSNVLHYTPVNQPPVVGLSVQPDATEYIPGTTLQFDASFFDPDGTVVSIEWDLDGNGEFEFTDLAATTQFQVLYEPGVYYPAFRATDNLGASQRIRLGPLNFTYGEAQSAAASVGSDTAYSLSAENFSGNLGLAYINEGQGKLCYLQAAFSGGELDSWSGEQVLGAGASDTSLALIFGNPAISYFNNGLYFTRAIDSNATNFAVPILVASGNPGDPVGLYNCLLFLPGFGPSIVSTDSSGALFGGDIWTSRAIDPEGQIWNLGIQVWADGQTVGRAPSVVETDFWPMLVYQVNNGGESDIHVMRSEGPLGDFYGIPSEVVTGEDAVLSADHSVLVHNGRLLVVYWSRRDRVLRCVQTVDQFLLEWGDPVDVATAPYNDGHYSLALIGGTPAVAYFTGGPTPETGYWGLKYTHAITDSARYWSIPQPLYADPAVRYPALVDIDGRPVVAFQAGADNHLEVGYFAPGS